MIVKNCKLSGNVRSTVPQRIGTDHDVVSGIQEVAVPDIVSGGKVTDIDISKIGQVKSKSLGTTRAL